MEDLTGKSEECELSILLNMIIKDAKKNGYKITFVPYAPIRGVAIEDQTLNG